ncbi:histidine kinase/DNA gyrase B/HSP90-like ATPase [Hydrogenispora ethanolica]|uniref:histidine kinase n=2 Tax=Hydrogenispora ethanolica TaxID=1082276 RepID=A0A4R1RA62_HYDET|nr:histidine kinase/DNA gyrase B/HSP90-like ATPase [Hydrogenispora ethanolica]
MMTKLLSYLQRFLRSMFGKIWVSQITLIILPVAIIGSLSFYASQQIINHQLIRLNTAALTQVEGNLSTLINRVYQLVTLYLVDSDIEKALKSKSMTPLERLQNVRTVEDKIMNYSLAFDHSYTHTMILGKNGLRYLTKNDSSAATLDDFINKDWYPKLFKAPNHLLWLNMNPGFESIPGQTPVLTFVKAMENQGVYGIYFFSLEESFLYDLYKNVPGNESQFYIVNGKGKILSHNHRTMVGRTLRGIELEMLLNHRPADETETEIYRRNHLITLIKKVHNMDWYIVYSVPEATHYQIIGGLKSKIAFIACLCFLLSAIIAYFMARSFSNPLVVLTRRVRTYLTPLSQAEKIAANAFEIDLLSSEYDMLIQRLDDTIHQLLREQEEKRKAEFHSLQMQINPHFLYNTLNSIKCLVWTKQIELIEPTLTALIKLLRQTVSLQDEIITLEEEIENIRNYIYLHQIRTGKNIVLNIHLAAGLEKCRLPKLLLQPMIENAIFHGIEPKNINGTIVLACTAAHHRVTIEIQDNGVGMDEAMIDKILTDNYASHNNFSGIGVHNVDRRIKLLYGDSFGLTLKSAPGIGTLVIITLPEIY